MKRPATEGMLRAAWERARKGHLRSHFFLPKAGAALIYKQHVLKNLHQFSAGSDTGTPNRSIRSSGHCVPCFQGAGFRGAGAAWLVARIPTTARLQRRLSGLDIG